MPTGDVIPLDGGGWQLRGCLGGEWRWHTGPGKPWDAPGWCPARVPGSVLDDLCRAGLVADPYYERNSLLAEWVPARSWIYRRRLAVRRLRPGERAVLRFGGVDHAATVLVDGEAAAEHEGMFTPFDVDVTDRLGDGGEHLLAVVVHAAPAGEPQTGASGRARVHKTRMGYGWDFCPRMIHQGIWRPVRLYLGPPPGRLDLAVSLSADLRTGAVDVAVPGALRLLDGERLVASSDGGRLSVDSPRPWWPNGAGEPHLYRLEVATGYGVTRRDIGFRHVELAPNEGAPPSAGRYCFVVNGRRLFANGWNWVPVDPLYGVPRPAKLAHLLKLAAGAHVNLLRVWGGGLIETAGFYRWCDRLGLLVWQEFALSSSAMGSVPPADPGFVAMMTGQARSIVRRRRGHPSLAVWCGGNELAASEPGRDDVPLGDGDAPVLDALHRVVRELDPGRAWFPSSPSGPRFLNRLDLIAADPGGQHDVHGPWEHQGLRAQYGLYDAGTCLLHSEFGAEGMASRRALEALISPERRWPADRSNPVYEHLGAWWNNAPLVAGCFGRPIGDLAALRRASQHLQYDGLRYAVEANRRRAFRCGGTLPWQFNESYPNAWCTAAVDHRGDPKPAYHGVRLAYRSRHVCARFATCAWGGEPEARAEIWVWGGADRVTARFTDATGFTAAQEVFRVAAAGAEPVRAGTVAVPLARLRSDVFLLDLTAEGPDGGEAGNRYLMTRAADLGPLLDLPPAGLGLAPVPGGVRLCHRAGPAALGVVLEDARPYRAPGWAVFADNVLHLLPGESRTVPVEWRDAPVAGRRVSAEGWNARADLTL